MYKLNKLVLLFLFTTVSLFSQEDNEKSNIQNYTPSKLLEKGKWDIKWFNNLYTQTKREDSIVLTEPRTNYFTTSLEIFTGVTDSKKLNAGLILEYRSNSFDGQSATSVFSFSNEKGKSRSGLAHIAPSLKVAPFNSLPNFSFQSSFFIPVFKGNETNEFGYLANKSYIWQNRFFYDHTFSGNKFQLFSELGTRFFFGKKPKDEKGNPNEDGGYANNSLELVPGMFLSYFPSSKFTVLGFLQQQVLIDLGNEFSQNFTAVGFGSKYQLSQTFNVEVLYSKFVRGNDTGLGQSFNLGLRAIF